MHSIQPQCNVAYVFNLNITCRLIFPPANPLVDDWAEFQSTKFSLVYCNSYYSWGKSYCVRIFILNCRRCPTQGFFSHKYSTLGQQTHSVWLKLVSFYQELIQMHPIFSRCTQTHFSFPHKGSFCIHLFYIYIWGCCRPWSVSLFRSGLPMCLAAGEPSDLGRVKDSAWANERMGRGMVSLNAWEPVTLCQC